MNTVEEELRAALDERAGQTTVDTAALWRATNRRLTARQARRSTRLRRIVPAVGAAAVAAAIVVPVWLNGSAGPPTGSSPTAVQSATPTTPPPMPSGTLPPWQHRFTEPPPWAMTQLFGYAKFPNLMPVDFVQAGPDGDFLLYATYVPEDELSVRDRGLCWHSTNLTENSDQSACMPVGLPVQDPSVPSNRWLSSSHMTGSEQGGQVRDSPPGLSFAVGIAANEVARVTAVDDQGRWHDAKLVGKQQQWPNQQYFFVVESPTTLVTIQAYDANGKLLGSVRSEDAK